MLTVIDVHNRRCLAVKVDCKLNSRRVLECLAEMVILQGPPDHIRLDNGSEFNSIAVGDWLRCVGVKSPFIEPGSPWQNGCIESFNSKLRDAASELGDI